jgi:hypothetical protein
MARRLFPSFIELWNKHVLLYSEVFSLALQELSELTSLTGDEAAISERLYLVLNRVCFALSKSRNLELSPPCPDTPIKPVIENELKGGKTSKRPDFSCNIINPTAISADEHKISLHVECKLLGAPRSTTWILNRNYVSNGIKRFDSIEHEYGKRAPSGMMIGYIISMPPEKIETDVNEYQRRYLPAYSKIHFAFNTASLFKTKQDIARKNVMPPKFELLHFWVDLRDCYNKG